MMRQPTPVHVPSHIVREHRTLIKYRKTAEVIVTALDDVDRFENARQVSAYIGLVPRQYQSGETDRNGRITKRGSRLLRTMLADTIFMG